MPATSPWKIPPGAADWECDWRGDQLFHLRLFRSFPLAEKILAVEEMAQVAEYFRKPKTGTTDRDGERRTATFSADFNNLEVILAFVGKAAVEAGLSGRDVAAVRLAVDEACSNIIEHAYRGIDGGTIEISCDAQAGRLTLLVRDQGRAFDITSVRKPYLSSNLDEREVGGLGVFLIRNLMDQVRLESSEKGGNLLTLVKRDSGAA